ncbi:hypothetical protein [Ligilactobacillus sp. LYQ60]|uniref:hypothetical protein n=1 Tax=Ligilactobacillus sp. LYQ60 TaxID=3378799 RepID=UPI003853D222
MTKSKQSKETFRTGSEIVSVCIPLALMRSANLSSEDKLVWVLAKVQEKLELEITADELAARYHLDPYSVDENINNLYADGYLIDKKGC